MAVVNMADLQFLVYIVFCSLHLVSSSKVTHDYDYCVIGAGPAGLQTAYFLDRSNRDYIVFERNLEAGSFYKIYPRHRKLISINKRFTGKTNKEFNMRHDWNSLLSDDETLKMTRYTKDFYPHADVLVKYLNDYATKLKLKISYNTSILSIDKDPSILLFRLQDQNSNIYKCNDLIVCTGMFLENYPKIKGIEHTVSYGSMSVNQDEYEGLSVLILGGGNAAFETAENIVMSTNVIHVMGRSRVRLAWATHYVGDVRAVNNGLLDNYQLKSLDGFLEKSLRNLSIVKHNGKLYIDYFDATGEMLKKPRLAPDNYSLRDPYDRILRCLGFQFDFSVFNKTTMPEAALGNKSKYPFIKPDFESKTVARMWFAGANAHSLDWRMSAGGFIHGYRYTARALHRILEWKNHGVKWTHHEIPQTEVMNYAVKRINEASGIYQMFSNLVDVVIYLDSGKAVYIEEIPVKLLDKLENYTGLPTGPTLVISMEYGKEFSGAGKDTFHEDRANLNPAMAHTSNFLHPVLYYYRHPIQVLDKDYLLPKPDRIHHVVEDFLTKWTGRSSHLIPMRRFLEHIQGKDTRNFFAQSCFKLAMTHSTLPMGCQKNYIKGSPLPGTPTLIDIAKSQNLLVP